MAAEALDRRLTVPEWMDEGTVEESFTPYVETVDRLRQGSISERSKADDMKFLLSVAIQGIDAAAASASSSTAAREVKYHLNDLSARGLPVCFILAAQARLVLSRTLTLHSIRAAWRMEHWHPDSILPYVVPHLAAEIQKMFAEDTYVKGSVGDFKLWRDPEEPYMTLDELRPKGLDKAQRSPSVANAKNGETYLFSDFTATFKLVAHANTLLSAAGLEEVSTSAPHPAGNYMPHAASTSNCFPRYKHWHRTDATVECVHDKHARKNFVDLGGLEVSAPTRVEPKEFVESLSRAIEFFQGAVTKPGSVVVSIRRKLNECGLPIPDMGDLDELAKGGAGVGDPATEGVWVQQHEYEKIGDRPEPGTYPREVHQPHAVPTSAHATPVPVPTATPAQSGTGDSADVTGGWRAGDTNASVHEQWLLQQNTRVEQAVQAIHMLDQGDAQCGMLGVGSMVCKRLSDDTEMQVQAITSLDLSKQPAKWQSAQVALNSLHATATLKAGAQGQLFLGWSAALHSRNVTKRDLLVVKVLNGASSDAVRRGLDMYKLLRDVHREVPVVMPVAYSAAGTEVVIVMPLAAGSLRDRACEVASVGWRPGEREYIARGVLAALDSMHQTSAVGASVKGGAVHGDVHEGNVLITLDGQVRLTDLDSSAAIFADSVVGLQSVSIQATGAHVARRFAPEVIAHQLTPTDERALRLFGSSGSDAHVVRGISTRSDMFQFGAMLYSLYTDGGCIESVWLSRAGKSPQWAESRMGAWLEVLLGEEGDPALGQLDLPEVPRQDVASLIAMLTDPQPRRRPSARQAQGHFGVLPTSAVYTRLTALGKVLEDVNRVGADVSSIPSAELETVRSFIRYLVSEYPATNEKVRRVLWKPSSPAALSALFKCTGTKGVGGQSRLLHGKTRLATHEKLLRRIRNMLSHSQRSLQEYRQVVDASGDRVKLDLGELWAHLPEDRHAGLPMAAMQTDAGFLEWMRRCPQLGWVIAAMSEAAIRSEQEDQRRARESAAQSAVGAVEVGESVGSVRAQLLDMQARMAALQGELERSRQDAAGAREECERSRQDAVRAQREVQAREAHIQELIAGLKQWKEYGEGHARDAASLRMQLEAANSEIHALRSTGAQPATFQPGSVPLPPAGVQPLAAPPAAPGHHQHALPPHQTGHASSAPMSSQAPGLPPFASAYSYSMASPPGLPSVSAPPQGSLSFPSPL